MTSVNLLRTFIIGFYNRSLYIQIMTSFVWEQKEKDMLKRKCETAFDITYFFCNMMMIGIRTYFQ